MDVQRKERLGTKWVCYSCGVRFYDLGKPEPLCPKCEADQRESPLFAKKSAKSARPRPRKAAKKKKVVVAKLPDLESEEAAPSTDSDTVLPVDKIDPNEVAAELSSDD